MIRNFIFDWSGTLVDDLPAVWNATNYVLVRAQRPEMTLEQFRAEFCLPFTIFYDRHVAHIPARQVEAWFHGRFQEVQDSVRELPHARDFLEFCRGRGLRVFVLSTARDDHFTAQANATGFGGFVEKAYVQVRDKRQKIHEILEANRLSPAETLFVGDMQHDIDTAKHGGVHSCAVLTGYNTLEQLRAAEPELIVEHLGELQEILVQGDRQFEFAKPTGGADSTDARRRVTPTVGALIHNAAGEVLMVRTHKWSDLWGIPGGKIKWGETSEAALRREIREETALEIENVRFVLVQDCIRSREFYREAHFLLLNYTCRCVGEPRVQLNEEAREFRWVAPEQALKLPLNQPTRVLLLATLEEENRSKKKGEPKHVAHQPG